MARGINKVFLLGHLGKDPEVKSFANGGQVANASLATSESWRDKQGQLQEHTEWHSLVFNDKLAEIAGNYLRKGSKIHVEGQIKTRKYQDREGKERYITEIRVRDLTLLDPKPETEAPRSGRYDRANVNGDHSNRSAASAPAEAFGGPDDDIPF